LIAIHRKSERAGISARCQLPIDRTRKTKPSLDHQMHQVVWHEWVITWRGVDLEIRKSGASYFHRIPPLTSAAKHKSHLLLLMLLCTYHGHCFQKGF
jgi:hypothetical protein